MCWREFISKGNKTGKRPFWWHLRSAHIFLFSTPSTTTYATGCNKCILLPSFFDLLSTNFTHPHAIRWHDPKKKKEIFCVGKIFCAVFWVALVWLMRHMAWIHVHLRYLVNTVNNLNPPFLTCYLLLVLLHVRRLDEE